MPGTADNVRSGPGWLYIAPVGATEPADLLDPWPVAWVALGYTDEGPEFVIDQTFENVEVAEELDPVAVFQTARSVRINVAAAEMTARNLQIALNGGTITVNGGVTTFEPPAVGDYTHVAIGWEATDGRERWIFRKALNADATAIPRRRAPQKANIPLGFQVVKPTSGSAWKAILDSDYVGALS